MWRAALQPIVTLSTCEAELVAMACCATSIMHVRQIAADLEYEPITGETTLMCCDNQSAMKLSEKNTSGRRTKHIDIRFYWIRGTIKRGDIKCVWVPSNENKANIFTKKLNNAEQRRQTNDLGLVDFNNMINQEMEESGLQAAG